MDTPIIEPKILPGFMELLPFQQSIFNRMLNTIRTSYELFGYLPVDTPVLEKAEIIMAKGGEETEKQTYTLKKGDNELALRFDLTVPLARYVSQRQNELVFPFKRYQIGKVYRGEKPQKGRFREFYQCDIDVIGKNNLSDYYDAEMVSVAYTVFKKLDLGNFIIRVSNRKLLVGFLNNLGLGDKAVAILRIADKKDKLDDNSFISELREVGINNEQLEQLNGLLSIRARGNEAISRLKAYDISDTTYQTGLKEIEQVCNLVNALKVPDEFWCVDLSIIRGLEYYTGTVYETNLVDYPSFGSVCGGGRYDNLTKYFSTTPMQGVGISIGLTRLFSQLLDTSNFELAETSIAKVVVIPLESSYIPEASVLANYLRQNSIPTDVYPLETQIKKKFDYANKLKVPLVAILGSDETSTQCVTVKDMQSGQQETVPLKNLLDYITQRIA